MPAQSEDQRQLFPPVQGALVQHVIPDGSEGQAPAIEVPPLELRLVLVSDECKEG